MSEVTSATTTYVYVLTNPAMPGMVKIGKTSADNAEDRASNLYTTGVPLPFHVEFAAKVQDSARVEKALHNAFKDSRVNPRREFFRIDPDQAIEILRLLDVEDATDEVRAEVSSAIGSDEIAATERFVSRRPPLNFDEMGMSIGASLVFKKDSSIWVTIVESKKVEHQGESVGLSRATKDILGVDYYVAPQPYWLFEGRSLTEIYDETYPVSGD